MPHSGGEARFLCSELITVRWMSEFGRSREVVANLEEIWESGAQVQFPNPVRAKTRLRIVTPTLEISGVVRSCAADFIGYFVEVDFEKGYKWSRDKYEPGHLFDPRSLLKLRGLKQKNQKLLEECFKMISSGMA